MSTMFAAALTAALMSVEGRAEMIMWAIQILLAVAFGAAGTMKLVRSKAQLAANLHMGWVHAVPEDWIKLLGVAEILGAIGLVVPMASLWNQLHSALEADLR
jgi:hypothetical protein